MLTIKEYLLQFKLKYIKPLHWPKNHEESKYIKNNQNENYKKCLLNKNENWMYDKLKLLGDWKRQYLWGYRIFDFYHESLGIAIEVDGPEHDSEYDRYRDEFCLRRFAIIVLRVRNKNEQDAKNILTLIPKLLTRHKRKVMLGISKDRTSKRLITGEIDNNFKFKYFNECYYQL